ncbi:MAG TPA: aminotransferase class V-fold PLP-dependent enzyme [Ignavibacteriales bacterium]|nr:aminotransferase class V-fold PLP-dependent enzyme [Ignavibacteriales bacterium]
MSEIDKEGIKIIEPSSHLPYVINVIFTSSYYNNDPESLLMSFDLNGVAISNGAACSSGTLKPSRVILNTSLSLQDAQGAVRFSFGPQNTSEEINAALQIIRNISRKFRKF